MDWVMNMDIIVGFFVAFYYVFSTFATMAFSQRPGDSTGTRILKGILSMWTGPFIFPLVFGVWLGFKMRD